MRDVQAQAERVDGAFVGGIDPDLPKHPTVGARVIGHERVRLGDLSPPPSFVVAAIDLGPLDARFEDWTLVRVTFTLTRRRTRVVVVHEGIHDVWIRTRNVYADTSAELRRRKPGACLFPAVPPVHRFPDSPLIVPGLRARVAPLPPDALPHRNVQDV